MNNTTTKRSSDVKHLTAYRELQRLLEQVSTRGFHGTATLTVSLQDGHVQQVRVASERLVRV